MSELLRERDLDCGNHSCRFARNKTGMRTNGPCTCVGNLIDANAALRATITQQAQEINKLKQEAVDTTNTHYDTISQIQQAARDAVKEDREQQAQELGRCKSEKNDAVIELYRKLDAKDAELAASQARCREMERELQKEHERSTEHFDLCVHKDTELAQLQATLAAREAVIEKMKAELNETWIDEWETVWTRPTAFSYAMVCKARDRHAQEVERLKEALYKEPKP